MIFSKVAKGKDKINKVLSTSKTFKLKKTAFISNRAVKKKKEIIFLFTFNQSLKAYKRNRVNKIKIKARNVSGIYFLKINKVYVNDEAMIEYLSLKVSFDLFAFAKIN